jgi:NitT/TauT family transport system substrate-binding protein
MADIDLALDWTPNTNHTGFYVAKAGGYYDDAGLDVTFRSPAVDDYESTPAKRVATGESTLAIAPSESAVSYHTHPEYASLVAVAAVCQRDTSAIAALAESDVDRPRDLDGRTYGSYDARFEDDIVHQLIRNDGGEGNVEITTPPKLGIPNTLLEGEADATWVFMPWEGLQAERDGIGLTPFSLEEYDVPYGYTPVVLAHPDTIAERSGELSKFLAASARGYREAAEEPEGGTRALIETADFEFDSSEFVHESQRRIAEAYLTADGEWGVMDRERWEAFVSWLTDEGILTDRDGEEIPRGELDVDGLYTTRLLG